MQDGETTAVSVAAALKASKVVNYPFRMLRPAAVGGYEATTRLLGCLLTRQPSFGSCTSGDRVFQMVQAKLQRVFSCNTHNPADCFPGQARQRRVLACEKHTKQA